MILKNKFFDYKFICEGKMIKSFQDVKTLFNVNSAYFSVYANRAIEKNKDSFQIKGKIVQIYHTQ